MSKEIIKFIGEKAHYEIDDQIIYGVDINNGLQILLQLRGLGAIQNLFKDTKGQVDLDSSCKFQDELGEWIVDAINRKLKSEKRISESPMMKIISEIYPNETLTISKFGLHANIKLTNQDNKKEQTSALPMDHHLDTERVIDVIKFLHKKVE